MASAVLGTMLMLAITISVILPAFVFGANVLVDSVLTSAQVTIDRFFLKLNDMIDDIPNNNNESNDNNDDYNNPKSKVKPYEPKFDAENETLEFSIYNETIILSLKAIPYSIEVNETGVPVWIIPPPEP